MGGKTFRAARALCALVCLLAGPLFADEPTKISDATARRAAAQRAADALQWRKGTVFLGDGLAKVELPDDYRFLGGGDSELLLTKIWHGQPGSAPLGIIAKSGFDPFSRDNWLVVLTFREDGYVKDGDAASIRYDELLQQMQKGTLAANEEREKNGYTPLELMGWATPPHYDARLHSLYWAKELRVGDEDFHALSYNIRMLGRRGVLVLNVVAEMARLSEVEAATPILLGMIAFAPGNRYGDYQPSSDARASYGIASLVADDIAVSPGFFKQLWLGLLTFRMAAIVAVLALAALAVKIRKSTRKQSPGAPDESAPHEPVAMNEGG